MTAETIVEIYRTQENRELHSFVAAVTITYFNDTAFVQGLSGTFTTTCWRELYSYFLARGTKRVEYLRHGRLKVVNIE